MLGVKQRLNYACQIGAGGRLGFGLRDEVSRLGVGQLEFALQVGQGDIEIQHDHFRGSVIERFHDGRKRNDGTQHLAGIGVSKRVRNDALRDAGGGDLV